MIWERDAFAPLTKYSDERTRGWPARNEGHMTLKTKALLNSLAKGQ
jgi:hypothetical protein